MTPDRPSPLNTRHRPGWPLIGLLGAGIVLVVIAFWVVADPLGDSDSSVNAQYTEAIVGVPSRINPLFVHLSDADRDIASLVFSGLVKLGKDGSPQPDLAESWDVSEDGKTVTFRLRSGVTWHSGAEFSSSDVLFTYALLASPELQADPEQSALWSSVKCAAPDALTVSCALPEPFAPFLVYASIGILPKYLLESTTPATIAEDPFNRSPIGTGPFRLTRLESDSATLRANDNYYLGRPFFDEINLRFYPDIESAAADLVRGEVQGLMVDLSINPTDFQALGTLDGLDEYVSNRSAYTSLFLNNTTPPLNEPAVRRAVALAVDKNSMISGLLGGRGVPVDSPVPPGSWAFNDDLKAPEHDIGEARNVLDEAGWKESEGGARTNGSTELRLTLLTDEDPLRGAVAEMIAEQLQDIGIETTVSQETSSDLVRDFLTPRNYQAAVFGWDPGPDPDPYPAWHSSQAQEAGRNIAGYASDTADEYMENGRQSFDSSERADLYRQFQSLFLGDAASVPLYSHLYTYFVSAEIKNVDPGLLFWPSSRFRNVSEWEFTAASQEIGG